MRLPDLSQLPGWKPSFELPANDVRWTASVSTFPKHLMPGRVGLLPNGRQMVHLVDGEETTSASTNGTIL